MIVTWASVREYTLNFRPQPTDGKAYGYREVRDEVDRLLDDVTLTTVALAIALGWSLYQVALGVSSLVTTYFTSNLIGQNKELFFEVQLSQGLSWQVGSHVLTFGRLVAGLIEFALVLAVALVVRKRAHRADAPRGQTDPPLA
jgi:hypothetical protein